MISGHQVLVNGFRQGIHKPHGHVFIDAKGNAVVVARVPAPVVLEKVGCKIAMFNVQILMAQDVLLQFLLDGIILKNAPRKAVIPQVLRPVQPAPVCLKGLRQSCQHFRKRTKEFCVHVIQIPLKDRDQIFQLCTKL